MTIIEKARELGMALAETDEYDAMIGAQIAFQSDPTMMALINEYNAKKSAMLELVQSGKFEGQLIKEISADMERLRNQLNEAPLYKDMQEKQKTFTSLVEAVSAEIDKCIGLDIEEPHCTGNCSACSGCEQN